MVSRSRNPKICMEIGENGTMKEGKTGSPREGDAMKDELMTTGLGDLREWFDASAKPVVRIDVERYQEYLDGSGMTDDQKQEFLEALWSIIVSFVELGFGVHPVQEVCGKLPANSPESPKEAFNRVSLGDSTGSRRSKGFSP